MMLTTTRNRRGWMLAAAPVALLCGAAAWAEDAPLTAPSVVAAPAGAENATAVPQAADPIIDAVRRGLANPAKAAADRDERQALAAFYATHGGRPLWVTDAGFTTRGAALAQEISRADDWGLAADAFVLPKATAGASVEQQAGNEITLGIAALKYARHARGGRLNPAELSRNFDQKPPVRDPAVVARELAAAEAPDAYLRGLHPQHPQFEKLRQALLKSRVAPSTPTAAEVPVVKIPDGPAIKPGKDHAHVALLRARLSVPADGVKDTTLDAKLAEAVKAFQKERGLAASGALDKATRSALNGPASATVAADPKVLVLNMERWRWMPENLGTFHVWDNIPEYTTRVVKNGDLVHSARIIVGKTETQTPLFSAEMKYVVFHPDWGVPDSIKVKELLPYLRQSGGGFFGFGADTRILQKHNLRVSYNGRQVDASQVDWSSTDIRRYTFIQPSGGTNVLGVLKFRFPNKHDVYMHDTPQRELFSSTQRTFSHGCVRVQDPRKLAEVLLGEDKGWTPEKIGQMLAGSQQEVELTKRIPVHITYFTAVAADDGTVKYYSDIYGHDARVAAALAGRPMPIEAPSAGASAEDRRPPGQATRRVAKTQQKDFFAGLFGN